jgi:hypothetical protein
MAMRFRLWLSQASRVLNLVVVALGNQASLPNKLGNYIFKKDEGATTEAISHLWWSVHPHCRFTDTSAYIPSRTHFNHYSFSHS